MVGGGTGRVQSSRNAGVGSSALHWPRPHRCPPASVLERVLRQASETQDAPAPGTVRHTLEFRHGPGPSLVDVAGKPVNDPRRRYELARQANEQVLSAHPEHPLAWFTKAQLHAVLDLDFAAAMDAFVEAERFGMPAVPVRVQQAALHLWSGDSRRALERVRLAEEFDPRSAQVKEYVARCLFHNGRVDAAYAKWDEALRIDPRDRYVFRMALRHALVNEDVVRARSLMIDGRRFPEIVPEWAEAWIRHLEGDSFRLRTLADRWTWDGAAAASPIYAGAHRVRPRRLRRTHPNLA